IFEPLLAGQDPRDIEALTMRMRHALFGHPFTKAGIEMALWDILGKSAGLPLYRLLGGPVREFVPTKWSISGVEPRRAAEIATRACARHKKQRRSPARARPTCFQFTWASQAVSDRRAASRRSPKRRDSDARSAAIWRWASGARP